MRSVGRNDFTRDKELQKEAILSLLGKDVKATTLYVGLTKPREITGKLTFVDGEELVATVDVGGTSVPAQFWSIEPLKITEDFAAERLAEVEAKVRYFEKIKSLIGKQVTAKPDSSLTAKRGRVQGILKRRETGQQFYVVVKETTLMNDYNCESTRHIDVKEDTIEPVISSLPEKSTEFGPEELEVLKALVATIPPWVRTSFVNHVVETLQGDADRVNAFFAKLGVSVEST